MKETTQFAEPQTAPAETAREYGFSLMVGVDGDIKITPHNLLNDFEFIGLVEYANQKKSDLLKILGMSIEARTLTSIGQLATVLSGLIQPVKDEAQVG